jgi:hypothetical protein
MWYYVIRLIDVCAGLLYHQVFTKSKMKQRMKNEMDAFSVKHTRLS